MKILLQNYSSILSSEPFYLNECINKTQQLVKCAIWNPTQYSVYDIFDLYQPDVFVCHYRGMNNDILKYFTSSNSKTELAINITGIEAGELETIETLVENGKLKCRFMFSNRYDVFTEVVPSKIKFIRLLPAADLFNINTPLPEFHIESAIIATQYSPLIDELSTHYKTYHKLKLSLEPDEQFDIPVNVIALSSFYKKYENVAVCDRVENAMSQVFFDAFLKSNRLVLKTPKDQEEVLSKIFAQLFVEEDQNEAMVDKIRRQIKLKHTCLNRSAQLLRELGDSESSARIMELTKTL